MDIKQKMQEVRNTVAGKKQSPSATKLSSGTMEKATLMADFFAKGKVKSISNDDMSSDNWINYGIPHQKLAKQVRKFLKIAHKNPEKVQRRLKSLGFMVHGSAAHTASRQVVKQVEKITEKAEQQIANNQFAEKLVKKNIQTY